MKGLRAARLDTQIRQLAFIVLRRLCGRIGHLPDSYLLSDEFDLSGIPRTSGDFADVRMGVFKREGCCRKVAESLRRGQQSEDTQGRGTSYTASSGITRASYSTSVKKWSCGRTCPIQTSSISSGFLTPSSMGDPIWSLNGRSTAI
jgi:hypothetical protein